MSQLEDVLKMKRQLLVTALQTIIKAELLQTIDGSVESGNATLALNESFQK